MADPNTITAPQQAVPRRSRPQQLLPRVPTRLRVPELVLGIGLVAAGALGSVLWATRGPSERIVVAARLLRRGEVLDASGVRWATVSGDRLTGITDTADLRGRVLVGDVPAGAPLQDAMLQPVDSLRVTQAEIAVSVDPGELPTDLASGDRVSVVLVTRAGVSSTESLARALTGGATVRSVDTATGSGATRVRVTLVVAQGEVAAIAGADDVRLARLPASPVSADAD